MCWGLFGALARLRMSASRLQLTAHGASELKAEVGRRSTTPHSMATPSAWTCCSRQVWRRRTAGGFKGLRRKSW